MKRLLLGLLMSSQLFSNVIIKYNLEFEFGRGITLEQCYTKVTVNGAELNCRCGKGAMMVIFYLGCFRAYCYNHMPDVNEPLDIDVLAKELDAAKK